MKSPQNKKAIRITALTLSIIMILGIVVTILLNSVGSFSNLFDNLFGKDSNDKFVSRDTINASLNSSVKFFDRDETQKIESSITYGQQNSDYLYLEVNANSPISKLQVGDCFMLVGDEDSAFGSTYFGKISYKYTNSRYNSTTLNIVTPSIYELFDNMDMDILQKLDFSNMAGYEIVEGDVEVYELYSSNKEKDNDNGSATQAEGVQLSQEDEGLKISVEIDLLKWLEKLGKGDSDQTQNDNEVRKEDAKKITVYYTETGVCYHRGSCRYVAYKDTKYTCNLYEAIINKSLRPCTICKPDYFEHYTTEVEDSDKKSSIVDAELTLKGTIQLTNITVSVLGKNDKEWNFKQGFENLTVKTTGDLTSTVTLSGNCSLDFGGQSTSVTVNDVFNKPFLTVEGLKEKMIPFLYCYWNGATIQVTNAPNSDDLLSAPLSIGILFYTDLYGNISFGCELSCSYTKKLEKNIDIFKDGKFLGIGAEKDNEDKLTSEDKEDKGFEWGFKAEMSGELTFEALGTSLMLYVGNVNLLELKVAALVAEGEFSLGFDSKKIDKADYGFYGEGDFRLHFDMFELNVKASVESAGGILNLEKGCSLGPLVDKTLWSLNKLTERDIVLVLDVSGSMDGTAMREAKAAAVEFINTIFEKDNDVSVGIVTYNSYAHIAHCLTNRKDALLSAIDGIYSGGSTDIEAGLLAAEDMLNERDAKKKAIVLLSDGEPNDGKTGDALVDYSKTIKDQKIYIFTLGFFQYLSGSSKARAQQLMENLANEGLHYEVDNVNDLVDFFGDIGEQLSGQKYIYIRIACPVDVTVTYNGETLSSKDGSLNTRTNFGTLTFEMNDTEGEGGTDNRIKVLRLKEGVEYDINISGNGNGHMNYTIGFMDDDGEYSDLREFKNIEITEKTKIETSTKSGEYTYLYIDKNGDGRKDTTYKASAEREGIEVKNRKSHDEDNSVAIIVIVIVLILIFAAGITVICVYLHKEKVNKN